VGWDFKTDLSFTSLVLVDSAVVHSLGYRMNQLHSLPVISMRYIYWCWKALTFWILRLHLQLFARESDLLSPFNTGLKRLFVLIKMLLKKRSHVTSKCNAGSETYLKFDFFCTNIDLFCLILFHKSHFFIFSGAPQCKPIRCHWSVMQIRNLIWNTNILVPIPIFDTLGVPWAHPSQFFKTCTKTF